MQTMTIQVIKGQKADITKNNPGLSRIAVSLGWKAPAHIELDTSAFLLAAGGKVPSDDHLIFYNNPEAGQYIKYTEAPASSPANKLFRIDLSAVPAHIEKLAVSLTIHEGEKRGQRFNEVSQLYLSVADESSGAEILKYDLGNQFSVETAIVVGEFYRYNSDWKFNAIGAGFSGGLQALCASFGIEVTEEQNSPLSNPVPQPVNRVTQATPPQPPPAPPSPNPVNLSKIELKKKGDKINLQKKASGALGEILVNLNWNQTKSGGFFKRKTGVDLDLACLYELKSGEKGVIQALGGSFGSLNREPFISLDGDDRTGSVSTGENIRINGNKLSEIKRILIFAFIYEGVTNWAEADGVVTIKQQDGPDIVVKMDEHNNRLPMCAIAMIQNSDNETLSIERLVQYYSGHRDLDNAYNWGLRWVAGSK